MNPPCVGKHELFDSTDRGAHEEAAKICASCALLEWCGQEAERVRDMARAGATKLNGTWAGKLHGKVALDPEWLAREESMFSDQDALAAHRDWRNGIRNDRTRIGSRVYERRMKRKGAA